MEDEVRIVQVLLDESKQVADLIQKKQGVFGQFGGIGIALVVAVSSFTPNPGRLVILLAAPLALTLIFMIMMQNLADANALSYYHRRLEDEINSHFEGVSLHYSRVLHERAYWSIPFGRALVLLFLVASFSLAGYAAHHAPSFRGLAIAFYWSSLAFSIAALTAGLRDLLSGERQARAICANPGLRVGGTARLWLR